MTAPVRAGASKRGPQKPEPGSRLEATGAQLVQKLLRPELTLVPRHTLSRDRRRSHVFDAACADTILARIALASTCIQRLMKHALLALVAAMVVAGCGTDGSHQSAGASPSVPRFDLSTQHGRAALAGFDPRYLVASASPESIPAIVRPRFESPRVASRLLRTTDFVIGVSIDGDARAYPVKLLGLHEVVNDVVAGRPIVVTWCPLCSSALVFDRRVGGETLTFGVSGFLYQANQVLYDLETRSLWSQLAEGAVTGALRGRGVGVLPAAEQPWGARRAAPPRTRVLSIRGDRFLPLPPPVHLLRQPRRGTLGRSLRRLR